MPWEVVKSPEGVQEMTGRDTLCHCVVEEVVIGQRLDSVLEVFYNLIDSVIPQQLFHFKS